MTIEQPSSKPTKSDRGLPTQVNMDVYQSFAVESKVETVDVPLSEQDKEELGIELLQMVQHIEKLEAEKKTAMAQFNAYLKEAKARQRQAAHALDKGAVTQEGTIHKLIFRELRAVGYYNEEGRLVRETAMSLTDGQMDLFVESSIIEARTLNAQANGTPSFMEDEA